MQFSNALRKTTAFGIGLIVSASLILAGCGGGGGGSSTPASSSLGGVAAVGYPIVGGAVQVKCAAGAALTTTTSSTGVWQVTLNGQTLPCAVAVSGGTKNNIANTTSYHSIAISAGVVNVTPFTDLLVANLTAQNPGTWFSGLTPALLAALTQAQVNTALANLRVALGGLTPLNTINPITTTFSAIPGNTMDDLLAALQLAMSNTSNTYATVLVAASSNSFASLIATLNAALPAAYTSVTAGASTGSNPGITGVFPASAAVGASVTISGTNFRQGSGGITSGDAYRVSFNGTTATPYLRTLTQLAVIVPVGATSGTLTVTDLITNQVYIVPGGFTVTGTAGGAISAIAITTAQNLTVGTAMASFSPLTPSGGATPYTYSYTGTLPPGLLFSTSTGVVSGTPTATYASANLVFSVKDANNVVASTSSTVSFTVNANAVVGVQMGGSRQGVTLNITAGSGVVSTFAGDNMFGSYDGIGTAASFDGPSGITTDGINLYDSDKFYNTIRKIVIATGQVSTLAGSRYSTAASIDGTGSAASFNQPTTMTTDGINLFVMDAVTNKIRKIVIATGVVTTLAGSGSAGFADGIGTAASFKNSGYGGMTTDGTYLYVSDTGNNRIRKVVLATGEVTTLAGSGSAGSVDGIGSAASFSVPLGITTDGTNLYVGEGSNLRQIVIATGAVTTLGTGFVSLANLTSDGSNLYVASSGTVRKIVIATAAESILAGGAPCGGGFACSTGLDGTGSAAKFNWTDGITTDGKSLYVTDRNGYYGNFIRKVQ